MHSQGWKCFLLTLIHSHNVTTCNNPNPELHYNFSRPMVVFELHYIEEYPTHPIPG